jgi:hypothetical protein
MKRFLQSIAVVVLCLVGPLSAPADAALGIDATAHPGGVINNIVTTKTGVSSYSNAVTPSFSTGAGPILLVLQIYADGSFHPFPVTVAGASLTWTRRVTHVSSVTFPNDYGNEIWTAYSATGNLSAQTVTVTFANTSAANGPAGIQLAVITGVGATEAASIGNTGGFMDDSVSGVSQAVTATVTPTATGSWLIGLFCQSNDSTQLTADSNTSAFDFTRNTTDFNSSSDFAGFGRYKVSSTVATTTSGTPVTFGSSTSIIFGHSSALEIVASSAGGGPPTGTTQRGGTRIRFRRSGVKQ